jgi:formate dehydrogenase gamma subunit
MNEGQEHRKYLRWTRAERWQHWLVAGSFILLALTGFALLYPDSWWSRPFMGIETRYGARGVLHRVAATIYAIVALFHAAYLTLTPRGRQLLKALYVGRRDLQDVMQNVGWLSGRRTEPANYDHFSYAEKAEYWALVWGTLVMGVTGAALWFEWLTLRFLPLWSIQVFTTIHLYEAWLATLAILVWHFYAVIFSPVVYPLNTSMVTGWISRHHMAIEHGRELEQLDRLEAAKEAGVAEPVGAGAVGDGAKAGAETA